jgi:hypothetical protein
MVSDHDDEVFACWQSSGSKQRAISVKVGPESSQMMLWRRTKNVWPVSKNVVDDLVEAQVNEVVRGGALTGECECLVPAVHVHGAALTFGSVVEGVERGLDLLGDYRNFSDICVRQSLKRL